MDKTHGKTTFFILLAIVYACATAEVHAQELNDELKKKLRESLINPDMKPLQQPQPIQIRPQQHQEVLKIAPTTKLPTKYDRLQLLYPVEDIEVKIDLKPTNLKTSQMDRSTIDYSTGKVHPVPDARSIAQWVQYTRGDYGVGIYVDENAPEWLQKIGRLTNPSTAGFDADPIRAIQHRKARKRQEKLSRILKAYGED